jgi:hypothetical protein
MEQGEADNSFTMGLSKHTYKVKLIVFPKKGQIDTKKCRQYKTIEELYAWAIGSGLGQEQLSSPTDDGPSGTVEKI